MSVNALLLSGLVLLLVGWLCCYARWMVIDLVDIFVLGVAIFFGIFDIIDSQVKGLPPYDGATLVSSQLAVLGVVVSVRVAGYCIPLSIRRVTTIRFLAECARAVSDRRLLAGLLGCFMFSVYGFYRFGIVGEGTSEELAAARLPYWFTSLKQIEYSGVLIGLLAASAVRFLNGSGARKALWLLAAGVTIAMVAIQGRRALFVCALLVMLLYSTLRQRNVYRPLALIWLGAAGAVGMLVFSDVFQTYRVDLANIALRGHFDSTASLGEAAVDTSKTLNNLEDRQGPWTYQYLVFQQVSDKGPLRGALLQQSVLNMVPSMFQAHKEVENVDDALERLYGLRSGVDLATNIIGLTFADFGIAGIVITPMMVIGLVLFVGWVLVKLQRWPFASVLVFGMAMNITFMIEGSYESYLGLLRLIGPVAIALVLWQALKSHARLLSAGHEARMVSRILTDVADSPRKA